MPNFSKLEVKNFTFSHLLIYQLLFHFLATYLRKTQKLLAFWGKARII